ncbi:MAG: ribulokinase [Clostridiales bacterium]|nr:ribulokinase [Clostridiales bacterium]
MNCYALGIDFGTLSARAALVSVADGAVAASASHDYPHGVMSHTLPCGKPLGPGWALQHPMDYLQALEAIVPAVLKKAGVRGDQVRAIGVDFTTSTTLPTLADGTPLCTLPEFLHEPNAYVKLWKHHADSQARHIESIAREMGISWLHNTGGRISPEWPLPKLMQILEECPALFDKTDLYLEAGDWIVWQLTGQFSRSASYADSKNFHENGYPPPAFFEKVHPRFAGILDHQFRGPVLPLVSCAGILTERMAEKLHLPAGIPVAPAMVDSHAGAPGAGVDGAGILLSALGTSACHILMDEKNLDITGIAAKGMEGIVPGLCTYEANQSMGEVLAWFLDHACPARCLQDAQAQGLSLHQYMNEKAALLPPGGRGLIALDWFNGNRSILVDSRLSGMLLGLTLRTQPEEIYRALMEASAYTMRTILENYEHQGLPIRKIIAVGGVARKSPLLMQIISDVTGREISVSAAKEGPAQGVAIVAAAGTGLFPDLPSAIRAMGQGAEKVYRPGSWQTQYEQLYREFIRLHDYFGRGENEIMHWLSSMH